MTRTCHRLSISLLPAIAMGSILGLGGLAGGADDPPTQPRAKAKATAKAKTKPAAPVDTSPEGVARQQAGRAAEAFLKLVDGGKYSESYDAASAWFRKGMPRRRWVDALTASRKPMGRVLGRKLDRVELRSLSSPDTFDEAWIYSNTRFEDGESRPELTIVSIDQGSWRMSGYFTGNPANFPKPSPPRR